MKIYKECGIVPLNFCNTVNKILKRFQILGLAQRRPQGKSVQQTDSARISTQNELFVQVEICGGQLVQFVRRKNLVHQTITVNIGDVKVDQFGCVGFENFVQ